MKQFEEIQKIISELESLQAEERDLMEKMKSFFLNSPASPRVPVSFVPRKEKKQKTDPFFDPKKIKTWKKKGVRPVLSYVKLDHGIMEWIPDSEIHCTLKHKLPVMDRACIPGSDIVQVMDLLKRNHSLHLSETGAVEIGNKSIASIPATEFPEMAEFKADHSITLPVKEFKKIVSMRVGDPTKIGAKYDALTIEYTPADQKWTAVSTESKQLTVKPINPTDWDRPEKEKQHIIPGKFVDMASKMVYGEIVKLSFSDSSKMVKIESGDLSMFSRLIDDLYPNWKMITLTEPSTIKLDKDTLIEAIEKISPLAKEECNIVEMRLSDGNGILHCHNEVRGSQSENFAYLNHSPVDVLGINVQFLLHALKQFDNPIMDLKAANLPITIRSNNESEGSVMIMPIILDN